MTAASSGPPYPRIPAPGSNAIGEFQIGISPIGTIPPFDIWATVLSQYSNSPTLTQLILNLFSYLDQTKNFDSFYDLIYNIDTAQGYGLDVWGRIVGVNRALEVQTQNWFGFFEALPGSESFNSAGTAFFYPAFGFAEGLGQPFGQAQFGLFKYFSPSNLPNIGAFYSGSSLTNNYLLSDESYRTLIFAKAAANITNGSIPAINQILLNLFPGRGNCYVTDGPTYATSYFGFQESTNAMGFNQASFYQSESLPTMQIQYVFEFQLTPVEIAIVEQSGVLPKPVGVAASTLII